MSHRPDDATPAVPADSPVVGTDELPVKRRPANWFRDSFSYDYLRIYAHRDASEAAATIRALLALVDVPRHAPVIDLACGFGRHLKVLRESGLQAVGLDLSAVLLAHAARDSDLQGHLLRADMRRLPLRDNAFAFLFSFFSSFGYFADDAMNQQVLNEMARVIRPGGGILMDFLNPAHVRRHLVPNDSRSERDFTLNQRRWLDPVHNTVDKELIIEDADGRRVYRESVKLYDAATFATMYANAGLRLDRVLGSPSGAPHSDETPRMIMIGRKV